MAIVVESTATAVDNNTTTLTITKPTGLSVGDLMIASLSSAEADGSGVGAWATLSGWTLANTSTFGSAVSQSIQYKVADSGDVAASNFTFTISATPTVLEGGIFRCSGAATALSITDALGDISTYSDVGAGGGAFAGPLTSYTPPEDGSLVIAMPCVEKLSGPGSLTFSSFSITSGVTPIELYQGGSNDGNGGAYFASVYGIQATATALTAYGASLNISADDHYGTFAVFLPTVDATGENTLVTATSTTFTQSGTCDTTGTTVLAEATAEALPQSGQATSPTQWANEAKPSTTWVNESK